MALLRRNSCPAYRWIPAFVRRFAGDSGPFPCAVSQKNAAVNCRGRAAVPRAGVIILAYGTGAKRLVCGATDRRRSAAVCAAPSDPNFTALHAAGYFSWVADLASVRRRNPDRVRKDSPSYEKISKEPIFGQLPDVQRSVPCLVIGF